MVSVGRALEDVAPAYYVVSVITYDIANFTLSRLRLVYENNLAFQFYMR